MGDRAASCPSCFERGVSVSDCRVTHRHCGPGVNLQRIRVRELEKFNLPQCCSHLKSITLADTTDTVETSYATGYLYPYTPEKWEEWLKHYSLQTDTAYKVCTGESKNKESDSGVLTKAGKRYEYHISWRQSYSCYRGGKPRYKPSKIPQEGKRVRNAPGSRLMDCKATITIRLLKTDCGDQLLEVTFPMRSAHTNHSPASLADLHSLKPLPEVIEKIESLITHSHLSQISLMLALRSWIREELIPKHIQENILKDKPSEYDRRYYPTVEDVRNISRKVINKIRHNMFDQDALENFLSHEGEHNEGFKFFLRKYTLAEDAEKHPNEGETKIKW